MQRPMQRWIWGDAINFPFQESQHSRNIFNFPVRNLLKLEVQRNIEHPFFLQNLNYKGLMVTSCEIIIIFLQHSIKKGKFQDGAIILLLWNIFGVDMVSTKWLKPEVLKGAWNNSNTHNSLWFSIHSLPVIFLIIIASVFHFIRHNNNIQFRTLTVNPHFHLYCAIKDFRLCVLLWIHSKVLKTFIIIYFGFEWSDESKTHLIIENVRRELEHLKCRWGYDKDK